MGVAFAHDPKAYGRWRKRIDDQSGRPKGLVGAALEVAVMGIAAQFPDNVIRGVAA